MIVSHYRGTDTFYSDIWDRYWANRTYRETLEDSDFGSASFKTRQENVLIDQANKAKPNSGGWQQVTFNAFDAAQTRQAEFQANYADIASQINE